MSIYENAVSGLRFNGVKKKSILDEAADVTQVRGSLGQRAGPTEVARPTSPVASSSACASFAPRHGPEVLLMDEPTSPWTHRDVEDRDLMTS